MEEIRIMGLDFGDRTIGIAISDAMGWTAQGITTLRRGREPELDIKELLRLCQEYAVQKIVVGLPRNMNGTYGPRAEITKEFASKLESASGLPVDLWDERLSTVAAEKILLQGDVSRGKRKKVIDQLAATIILQNYLDAGKK